MDDDSSLEKSKSVKVIRESLYIQENLFYFSIFSILRFPQSYLSEDRVSASFP